MKYFIKRTLAYTTDCIVAFAAVMLIIQWAILSHTRALIGITDSWFQSSINMQLYVLATISIPVWIYFTYFDSIKSRGTVGKRIFKLSVKDSNNHRIGLGKSLCRTILKLLPWEIAHLGVIFPTPLYYENEPSVRILTYVGIFIFVVYAFSIWIDIRNRSIYDRLFATIVSEE